MLHDVSLPWASVGRNEAGCMLPIDSLARMCYTVERCNCKSGYARDKSPMLQVCSIMLRYDQLAAILFLYEACMRGKCYRGMRNYVGLQWANVGRDEAGGMSPMDSLARMCYRVERCNCKSRYARDNSPMLQVCSVCCAATYWRPYYSYTWLVCAGK